MNLAASNVSSKRRWLVCFFAMIMAIAARAQEEPGEDWMKHFRIGGAVGLNLKTKFTMGGQFNVSGTSPGTAGTGGNHTYDDGFVKVDASGNPDLTGYWGYNNASQANAGAQTLTFHSAKSFSLANGDVEKNDVQVGLDLGYGADLGRFLGGWYGWDLGFSFLPISTTDRRALGATFTRTVHQYNTGDIFPLPDPPYHPDNSGLGPNIQNTAIELPDDTIGGTITGKRTLEVYLLNLRLGPTMYWEIRPHFGVQISAGPAFGYGIGRYKFDETISLTDGSTSHNSGSFSKDKFLVGGYFSALLMYHTSEKADIFVGFQFMSLGSMSVGGAGRKAELDMSSGFYFTAGVNWPF